MNTEENTTEAPASEVDTTPAIPELPVPTDEACSDPCCYPGTPADTREHNSVYWAFLDKLEGDFRAFLSEARAGELNKSAALRARKTSVVLRKSLKEYREVLQHMIELMVVRRRQKLYSIRKSRILISKFNLAY